MASEVNIFLSFAFVRLRTQSKKNRSRWILNSNFKLWFLILNTHFWPKSIALWESLDYDREKRDLTSYNKCNFDFFFRGLVLEDLRPGGDGAKGGHSKQWRHEQEKLYKQTFFLSSWTGSCGHKVVVDDVDDDDTFLLPKLNKNPSEAVAFFFFLSFLFFLSIFKIQKLSFFEDFVMRLMKRNAAGASTETGGGVVVVAAVVVAGVRRFEAGGRRETLGGWVGVWLVDWTGSSGGATERKLEGWGRMDSAEITITDFLLLRRSRVRVRVLLIFFKMFQF